MSDATSTRVCIKQLPSHYVNPPPGPNNMRLSNKLKETFPNLTITDIYIPKTASAAKQSHKNAKATRLLAFVGFSTPESAAQVVSHFNNSFFDTTKIKVELARSKTAASSADAPRSWSKWSEGSSAYEKRTGETPDTSVVTTTAKGAAKNAKKEEFVAAMTSRKDGKFWSNDDGAAPAEPTAAPEIIGDSDSEDEDEPAVPKPAAEDEDSENNEADPLQNAKSANAAMSDLDFFKSKVVQKADLEAEGEETPADTAETETTVQEPAPKPTEEPAPAASTATATSTIRLFVRNLPFTATETELSEFLSSIAVPTLTHIPLDDKNNKKGFAYATFNTPSDAAMVQQQLDGGVFQGRLVHLLFAKEHAAVETPESATDKVSASKLTYKQKMERERKLKAADEVGWNASFLRSDTVVSALADKLQVDKGDIMDHNESGMAVRLALGETKLIEENKAYFKEHGINVDLESLKSITSASGGKRSSTTILVKNLPYETTEEDLTKTFANYGIIAKLLLPPSRAVAIIEYSAPGEARKAFKKLAYTKFKHVPLYLEWAPEGIVKEGGGEKKAEEKKEEEGEEEEEEAAAEAEAEGETVAHSVFVKNLKFSTSEDALGAFFTDIAGPVMAVKIPTKTGSGGETQSMGYGFVEFETKDAAKKAIREGGGKTLDGHVVEVKLSVKSIAVKASKGKGAKGNKQTKLMVRNLPFEASREELQQLFGNFGTLKKVTIPKKFDGTSRGFGFVDFLTSQEAATAKESLAQTHLYGRHLIIEYSEDKEDLETLRDKAKRDVNNKDVSNMARKKKRKGGDGSAVFE